MSGACAASSSSYTSAPPLFAAAVNVVSERVDLPVCSDASSFAKMVACAARESASCATAASSAEKRGWSVRVSLMKMASATLEVGLHTSPSASQLVDMREGAVVGEDMVGFLNVRCRRCCFFGGSSNDNLRSDVDDVDVLNAERGKGGGEGLGGGGWGMTIEKLKSE